MSAGEIVSEYRYYYVKQQRLAVSGALAVLVALVVDLDLLDGDLPFCVVGGLVEEVVC